MNTRIFKFIPVVGIIIAWLLFAHPYFFKYLVPFPSDYLVSFFPPWSASYGLAVKNNAMPDIISQIYPWKKLTIETWKLGQIPLWNPYSFAGTPHAANFQTAVFSPFNLLFFLLPHIDAWSVLVLLQPLLAGVFMYMFLRSITLSRVAGVFGAISFMFCGFMVVWMAYGTLGYAVLFLPFILWGLTPRQPNQVSRKLIFVSLGVLLSLVSGHFQMSAYVILASIAWSWYLSVIYKNTAHGIWGSIYILLGIALSAPQLLLTHEAYASSVRSTLFGKGEIIPYSYLVTIFAPDFYGNPVTRNDWFGHYAEWASFIGVTPLFFALLACFFAKNMFRLFFLIIAIGSLLCALPTPINTLLYSLQIPVFSTSAASRIIVLTSFALATLGAIGLDSLRDFWETKKSKRFRLFIFGAIGCIILFWLILLGLKPLPPDKIAIAVRNSMLPTVFWCASFVLFITGLWVKRKLHVWICVFIVLVAFFDLYRFSSKWMPFAKREHVFPETAQTQVITSLIQKDHARVYGNFGGEFHVYHGVPGLEGYDAVYNADYGNFISAFDTGTPGVLNRSVVQVQKDGKYTDAMLGMLGVKYYFHRISDGRNTWAYPFWNFTHYNAIWRDDVYELFQNRNVWPRIALASSYEFATSHRNVLSKMFDSDGLNQDRVVLEKQPEIEPRPGTASAHIRSYTPNKVEIAVDAQAPKVLFLADSYDPGWHVSVDGQTKELYRANYHFRAVSVPSGKHIVTMSYWPQSFWRGVIISGFATLVLLGLYIRKKRL